MNSISLRNSALRALFAVIWLALALVLLFCAGFRFNPTPSLPKGIYRLVSEAPTKSDLVSFCLEGEFAELALERGYLEPGSCPSGLRSLLKRLADHPGSFDSRYFGFVPLESLQRVEPIFTPKGN